MQQRLSITGLFLRLALAATFFSAVASRLNLWNGSPAAWNDFLVYTSEVNSFMPPFMIPILAISATVLEIIFSILLCIGYKTKWAAIGAGILTGMFALAMAVSFGIKSPMDYSVFVDSAAAFFLASIPCYKWSLDAILKKQQSKNNSKTIDHERNN